MRLLKAVSGWGHASLDNAAGVRELLRVAVSDRRLLDPELAGDGPGALSRLSRTACLAELAAHDLGRLAYVRRDDVPDVVPVNYRLVGTDLLIVTGPGSKLLAGERGAGMALEIDEIDPRSRTGWSVVAVGRATVMQPAERAALPAGCEPAPWVRGPRRSLLRLRIDHVDGRRLTGGTSAMEDIT